MAAQFLCDASLFPGLKDRPNHHGETPLITQARACHVGAVMALLKHGANPLANDRYGHSPSAHFIF